MISILQVLIYNFNPVDQKLQKNYICCLSTNIVVLDEFFFLGHLIELMT